MKRILLIAIASALCVCRPGPAAADLAVLGQFDPVETAGFCGLAFAPAEPSVWVYDCSAADIRSYSAAGSFLFSAARPGEAADDVDVEIAPEPLAFSDAALPAGTLLFINGETGAAEIYAIDPATGSAIDTLETAFGVSHVVGGAYHPGRDTFFLVQDRVPAAGSRNRIAEIDPLTGQVLNSFEIGAVFDVNYGDLDVCHATGNLLLVSSVEPRIGEFTPDGLLVQSHTLPAGVSGLSGIGHDGVSGETWVCGTGGAVWRLGGLPCATVGVESDGTARAASMPARPNPSKGSIAMRYTLPASSTVTVRVYDASGRLVRTVFEGAQAAKAHEIVWDARDDRGEAVASGVYLYEIRAERGIVRRESIVLLR